MFSTYSEAISWLQNQLPVFHLQGKTAFNPSLDTITYLCNALDNPQLKYPTIHIAGTNGKGSTANMLASTLQEAGYKTALYTSPHVLSFTERIKINGKPIAESELLSWVNFLYPIVEKMPKKPSFFELTTAIAFTYFAQQKVDITVIETGLGGRLDATNVVQPVLSIITRISYDHTDILGDTLEQIATEKAGIIKPRTPVFIGKRNFNTDPVFLTIAQSQKSPIFFIEDHWNTLYKGYNAAFEGIYDVFFSHQLIYPDLEVGLLGKYQTENIALVCAVINFLSDNQWDIKDMHLYRGMKNIQKNMHFIGRMQVISTSPLHIADIAHNPEGISAVVENLSHFDTIHAIIGILRDKDIKMMLNAFPKNTFFYTVTPNTPRGISAGELSQIAQGLGYVAQDYNNIPLALSKAKENCKNNDVIYTGGSNYVVSMLLQDKSSHTLLK